MNFLGKELECDQNGNFFYAPNPNSQKESVLEVISETLRDPSVQNSSKTGRPEKEEINKSLSFASSEALLNHFNPGDKLSSPIPPLAPQNADSTPNETYSTRRILDTSAIFTEKDCHLSTVLGSAKRCLKQLKVVKDGLVSLVSQDDRLSKGRKISNPGSDYELISLLGEYVMQLTRQVFTPAHQLYISALGLHMAEDLIRNPSDPALLNFRIGYVNRPDWNTITHTQMKLRGCVDTATEMYNRFARDASTSNGHVFRVEQMQYVMVTLMHALQDLYATAIGSTDIFKILLHIEDYGEKNLQEFLFSLNSTERSDLLLQVQALRRIFDDLVIMIEQLSWTAYIVYRLASGKSLTPSPDGSNSRFPSAAESAQFSKRGDKKAPVLDSIPRKPSSSGRSSTSTNKTEVVPSSSGRRDREPSKSRETSRHSLSNSDGRRKDRDRDRDSSREGRYSNSGESYSRSRAQEKAETKPMRSLIPTPTGSPQQPRSRRHSRTNLPRTEAQQGSYSRSASRSSSKGSLNGQNINKKPAEGKEYSHSSSVKSKKHKSKSRSSSRESGLSVRDPRTTSGHSSSSYGKSRHSEQVPSQHKSKERDGSHKHSNKTYVQEPEERSRHKRTI